VYLYGFQQRTNTMKIHKECIRKKGVKSARANHISRNLPQIILESTSIFGKIPD